MADPGRPYMTILMHASHGGRTRIVDPTPLEIHSRWSAVILFSMARKLVLAHGRKRQVHASKREREAFERVAGELLDRAGFERTGDPRRDILAALEEVAVDFEAEEAEEARGVVD